LIAFSTGSAEIGDMKPTNARQGNDRPILSLLEIRSPLTRVAYSVPADSACLVILYAGNLSTCEAEMSRLTML
jgi:hypothetical protein